MFDQETWTEAPQHQIHHIKDSLSSLCYRLKKVEADISGKIAQMDRGECLAILQNKVNTSQLNKFVEEINEQLAQERKREEHKFEEIREKHQKTITKLTQKLNRTKPSQRKKDVVRVKPQELFLESNETMFSILIDEISQLKQISIQAEQKQQYRQKCTLSLNNEVCKKLEWMEAELEHMTVEISKLKEKYGTGEIWLERKGKITSSSDGYQSMRVQFLSRSVQMMQKELAEKLNIRDVVPVVHKTIESWSDQVQEMRKCMEEGMESTKKILLHQSEINHELSMGLRVGWWQSWNHCDGFAVWEKEIINLFPEGFILKEPTSFLIHQPGLYLIKILPFEKQAETFSILLNDQSIDVNHELLLKFEKDTVVSVPSTQTQILLLSLHKL